MLTRFELLRGWSSHEVNVVFFPGIACQSWQSEETNETTSALIFAVAGALLLDSKSWLEVNPLLFANVPKPVKDIHMKGGSLGRRCRAGLDAQGSIALPPRWGKCQSSIYLLWEPRIKSTLGDQYGPAISEWVVSTESRLMNQAPAMKLDTAPSCLRLCGKNHSVLKQRSSVLGRVMRCGIDLMLLSGVALQNLDSRTGCLFLGQSVRDPKTTRTLRQMVRPAAKPSSR